MRLSEEFDTLLDQCRSNVEELLESQDSFTMFALALQPDGEVISVLADDEGTDMGKAIGGILKVLLPLAKTGKIIASSLCTPISPDIVKDGRSAAVFDMEHKDGSRIYAVLPFYKHDYLGWQYGPMEYTRGKTQIFVRNPQ